MSEDSQEHDYLWKVILIGDSGVGKSNLVGRFTNDQFHEETKATIGVEFCYKHMNVDGKDISTQIWDTSGQERFRSLTRSYYRGAIGALVVYGVNSRTSFENCDSWLYELAEHAEPGILVVLVGNKIDLCGEREVSTDEGVDYSTKNNIPFVETSAKDSTNVNQAFETLVREIHKQHSRELMSTGNVEEPPDGIVRGQAVNLIETPVSPGGKCEC
eukprot:TRINITY_DN6027_c0_g1_i3.p1 TRINITY_DN6027_c0_g1~~TRINITY_DN6027_c0_g1_i3.p1  ORF type:complete len:215 (-),score=38.01 TRINITY_DN6027_c0_g1_i3:153-797(-)